MATEGLTERLVEFAAGMSFDRLPGDVVHEAKRLILDSLGCAVSGLSIDKGKLAVELALEMGGRPQSSILGLGTRTSCAYAAFANGELMNAVDYEANLQGHTPPVVLPPILAVAEYRRVSGRELILATAVGIQIGARLVEACPTVLELVREGEQRGSQRLWPALGYSSAIFGGSLGAGLLLGLDRQALRWAMGIAGYIAPVPCQGKWQRTPHSAMPKYGLVGWMAQGGATAALLAARGYTGDETVLDGDHGFGRFYNHDKWKPALVVHGLGEDWFPRRTSYKAHPNCSLWHTVMDCFEDVVTENALVPNEIEQVTLFMDEGILALPVWTNEEVRDQMDAQFSAAYGIAMLAHGVNPRDWYEPGTMEGPAVRDFMGKVKLTTYPGWGQAALQGPGGRPGAVEVVARGRTFRAERKYARGGVIRRGGTAPGDLPPEGRLEDAQLVDKFRGNVARVMPHPRIERVVDAIMRFEEVPDVSALMGELKP